VAAEEAELRREEQRLAALAVQEGKRRQMAAGAPFTCFTSTKVQILTQRGLVAEQPGHWKLRQRVFVLKRIFFLGGGPHRSTRNRFWMEAKSATAPCFTHLHLRLLLLLLPQRSTRLRTLERYRGKRFLYVYWLIYDCFYYCREARGAASGARDGSQGASIS